MEFQAGTLPMDLTDYWSPIFEEESVEDDRPFATINDTVTEMQDPITRWDVEIAFRGLKDSCSGHNGIRKRYVKEFSYDDLAVHISLATNRNTPASFKTGIVTFITKIDPLQLSRLWPAFFIASLEGECWDIGFCHRDKVFRQENRIAQNLFLIKSIIRKNREQLQKLNLTFIDVTKGFDSASHKSIIRAAARLGHHSS